jgi:hypothetical protein
LPLLSPLLIVTRMIPFPPISLCTSRPPGVFGELDNPVPLRSVVERLVKALGRSREGLAGDPARELVSL